MLRNIFSNLIKMLILMVVFFTMSLSAQQTDFFPASGQESIFIETKRVYFEFTADSLGGDDATVNSTSFTLQNFDGVAFGTYKPTYYLDITGTGTGAAADSVAGFLFLQVYANAEWDNIDTLNAAVLAGSTTSAAYELNGTMDFNEMRGAFYRFQWQQAAVGSAISAAKFEIIFPKREEYYMKY